MNSRPLAKTEEPEPVPDAEKEKEHDQKHSGDRRVISVSTILH